MEYFIQRGEERYGPYNVEELQRYVRSGNIILADVAQGEGMSDWTPVSEVLGSFPNIAPVALPPMMHTPFESSLVNRQKVPLPPNLPWVVVLLILYFIWIFVQANWARKLVPGNKALVLLAFWPAGIVLGIAIAVASSDLAIVGLALMLGGSISFFAGVFSIRAAMEQYYNSVEIADLDLGPVMTFFLGPVYFQYHINRLHKWKQEGLLAS